jgi:hypothetical protein
LNNYAAPLDKLPVFVKAGAIIPMYPEMLYDREKPKDPVTVDVYPFGKSSFSLYEDDGTTQAYRKGAFARTLIEAEAPKSLDVPEAQITVNVGSANGTYKGMPASRSYMVDVHVPAKPASVKLGDRDLPVFEITAGDRTAREKARQASNDAPEGWFFDAGDRAGVLHVKIKPQPLSSAFSVRINM